MSAANNGWRGLLAVALVVSLVSACHHRPKPEPRVIFPARPIVLDPLVVSGQNIFFRTMGGIWRVEAPLGRSTQLTFGDLPEVLWVAGNQMFWDDATDFEHIHRLDLAAGTTDTVPVHPLNFVVDRERLYNIGGSGSVSVRLDGTLPKPFVREPILCQELAQDVDNVYCAKSTDRSLLQIAKGDGAIRVLQKAEQDITALAATSDHLYWIESTGVRSRRLLRVLKTGGKRELVDEGVQPHLFSDGARVTWVHDLGDHHDSIRTLAPGQKEPQEILRQDIINCVATLTMDGVEQLVWCHGNMYLQPLR